MNADRVVIKREVQRLVSSVLKECPGEDCSYLLENVLPTLMPGLIQVMQACDKKAATQSTEIELNPLNFLGAFLYRNNPRVSKKSSAKVEMYRGLVQDIIVEEKRRKGHVQFQRKMRSDAETAVLDLGVWPCTSNGEPEWTASLHSANTRNLLAELEWQSGLVGLGDEFQVILDMLDVRKSGVVEWDELVKLLSLYVESSKCTDRFKISRDFREQLFQELRRKIDQALTDYYNVCSPEELFETAATGAGAAHKCTCWDSTVAVMDEIKSAVLGWGKGDVEYFEPEDILDAQEMKCSEDLRITQAEFAMLLSNFLDQLCHSRVAYFSL